MVGRGTVWCIGRGTPANNTGETSLEACMKNSMHPSTPAAALTAAPRLSYDERKQMVGVESGVQLLSMVQLVIIVQGVKCGVVLGLL